MNRFTVTLSVLALATTLAAGCKKEEAKKTDDPAATPAGGAAAADPAADPAAAAKPEGEAATASAPAGNMSIDEACTKSIGMMEGMGAAVSANTGNCDAMGDALQKWADDNKELIAWGKAQDGDEAKKKEFEEKCAPKMAPVMEKVGASMEGASACAQNEKVKAALATLE